MGSRMFTPARKCINLKSERAQHKVGRSHSAGHKYVVITFACSICAYILYYTIRKQPLIRACNMRALRDHERCKRRRRPRKQRSKGARNARGRILCFLLFMIIHTFTNMHTKYVVPPNTEYSTRHTHKHCGLIYNPGISSFA